MKAMLLSLLVCVGAYAQLVGNSTVFNAVGGIGISLVGSNATTSAATSYQNTIPYLPRQNSLLLAWCVNSKASAPDIPTATGHALTYTQIRTTNYFSLASPTCRLTVFYAHATSGMTTNAFTADFGAASQTGCIVGEVEIVNSTNGGSPDGTNAFTQIIHNGGNVNTNITVTFAALSGTRNLQIMFFGGSLNSVVMAAEAGWTKLADLSYNVPATEGGLVYKLNANDTSGIVTNATATSWATVGVEIAQRAQFRP